MVVKKRTLILTGLAMALVPLTACSDSNSDVTVAGAGTTAALTTTAPAPTTAAPTTPAPTTAAPTTAAPTTAAPAPSGPAVDSVTTPQNNITCAEATAQANLVTVSWKATGAASVTLAIDNPSGAYDSGLPAEGKTQIPATCGDTQDVYIIPVAADGTAGTPTKITITVDA
jgi:hypothetical protein